MGGRHQGIGRRVVVRVAKAVRVEEHERREQQEKDRDREAVLHRVIGMERHRIFFHILHVYAGRVVVARGVERPDVENDDAENRERQEVVQREKAIQSRIIDRRAAEEQRLDRFADDRERGEEIGDDGRAPERHLAPGEHIAHEGRRHHQNEDDDAEDPVQLARLLVGPVIEPAEHVDVDGEEEHRGAVGVRITHQPAVIHIAHDVLDAVERHVFVRRVVHGEHDAGDDLRNEADDEDGAEGPPVIEVLGRRKFHEIRTEAHDRQALVEPALDRGLGLVCRSVGHRSLLPNRCGSRCRT